MARNLNPTHRTAQAVSALIGTGARGLHPAASLLIGFEALRALRDAGGRDPALRDAETVLARAVQRHWRAAQRRH